MADSFIQVPTDGTGKSVDTRTNSGGEHRQVIVVGSGSTDSIAGVDSTNGLDTNPTDRALRDLGKVDVAGLDQYTPTDVDSGAGSDNALPIALRFPASGGGVTATGDATNGLDVDVTRVGGNVTVVQGTASNLKVDLSGTAANATAIKVDGSAVTQPISAASLPLPSGAATAAKQPALGTAGTPSSDVITIQGIASMTAVKVDGSGVTQPVSAASLPLPTGAATSAKQDTMITSLQAIDDPVATIGTTPLMRVAVFDASDNQVTSFGGAGGSGTEYTEDAAAAANPVGGIVILRRKDTLSATEVSADGDNIAANATAKGELYVKHVDAIPITDNSGNISIDDGGNSITVDGTVAVSGTVAVTDNSGSLTVDFNDAIVGTTGSAVPAKGLLVQGSDGTNARNISTTTAGVVKVDLSATAANSTAVKVDASSVAVPVTDNSGSITVDAPLGTPVFATLTPNATGGWSVSSQTALSNTKTQVKGSAGTFGGYMFYNPNASAAYIQVFDVANASVTVGTTTPTYVIPIPATSAANVEFTNGINHGTAVVVAATTTATGSTALGSALTGFFLYK